MQTSSAGRQSQATATTNRTVPSAIKNFVETTTDALADAGADPRAIERVEQAGETLVEATEEFECGVEQTHERARAAEEDVDTLEKKMKSEFDSRGRKRADDRKRLTAVENAVEDLEDGRESTESDDTPGVETGGSVVQSGTPLEDVIRVPEHLVEEALTANQQRARFVAKDAHQYTRSVPAGRAIKSSELRRVLSAGAEEQVYTKTVSRVIRFLDKLGKDDVMVRESASGERVVVFTDALVKRIVAWQNQRDGVVTGEEVTG